ncbi:MAG: hypothetical protein ACK5WN_16920, partial [Alphaproteobacteria bacterium]
GDDERSWGPPSGFLSLSLGLRSAARQACLSGLWYFISAIRRDFSQAIFHVVASGGNRSNRAHGNLL